MPRPSFNYTPIPYAEQGNTLAELLLRQGQQQAAAVQQRGEIAARLWSSLGQQATSAIQAAQQAKREEPFKLAQLENLQAQREERAAQSADRAAMTADRESKTKRQQAIDVFWESHADLQPEHEKEFARIVGPKAAKAEFQALFPAPELMSVTPGAPIIDKLHPERGPVYTAPEDPLKMQAERRAVNQAGVSAMNLAADNARADASALETGRHNRAMEARPVGGAMGVTGMPTLDEGGLEFAATQYRVTGKMPALGQGRDPDRKRIINMASAQSKALGQSAAAAIQKQAAYAGDTKALAKMQAMASSAQAFESKASAQAEIVKDLSAKVPRSNIPLLNKWIVAGKADVAGDVNAQLLYNAIETFSAEYAKIMEGATGSAAGSSDSSRAAAKRLINAGLTKGQIDSTVALMQREMQLTMQGYGATIADITERMRGTPAATASAVPAPVAAPRGGLTYDDYLKAKGQPK